MELTKLIGLFLIAGGILALLILAVRKGKEKKIEEEQKKRKEEEEERARQEEQKRRDAFLAKLDFRRDGPIPRPNSILQVPKERSMILSYNTVFLTDMKHPARVYKADLFHPAYVGRSRDNDICIREESVSRRHMRIFRDGALVYAENLNSMNGTLLNGKTLVRPQEIITGSILTLGRVELKVEID